MTNPMPRRLTSTLARLVASAGAGALITYTAGQVALWLNGTCSVLCQPSVALTFGSVAGMVAFWHVGKE